MGNADHIARKFERAMEINWARGQQLDNEVLGREGFQPLLVKCPVCISTTALAYKSLWVATCRAGHNFDRCKLTLLPITDIKWRKTCSDCKLEFIDEYKHPEMKIRSTVNQDKLISKGTANGNDVEIRSSAGDAGWLHLANHVFDKFDRCPYCEGYFTG